MKYIKYLIVLYLFIIQLTANSDTLDSFIRSLNEQEITASWVASNSSISLTQQKTISIVSHTYAHSISNDLNPKTLIALIKVESGFNSLAKSNHNALGITQIMYKIHYKKFINKNPFNINESIRVGALILKECYVKNKNNRFKSLNCYSGGGGYKYYNTIVKYENDLNSYISKLNSDQQPKFAYIKND